MSEEYYEDEYEELADESADDFDAGSADEVEDALADIEAYEDAAYDDAEDVGEHADASGRHTPDDGHGAQHFAHGALPGAAAGHAAARARRSRVHEYTEGERQNERIQRRRQAEAGEDDTAAGCMALSLILLFIVLFFVCC